MKNLKILLPMLAIIFAIGLTYAAVDPGPEIKEQANDYILINGSWRAIAEQSCEEGEETCRVKFNQNGPEYEVYDEMSVSTLKDSPTSEATIIDPLF